MTGRSAAQGGWGVQGGGGGARQRHQRPGRRGCCAFARRLLPGVAVLPRFAAAGQRCRGSLDHGVCTASRRSCTQFRRHAGRQGQVQPACTPLLLLTLAQASRERQEHHCVQSRSSSVGCSRSTKCTAAEGWPDQRCEGIRSPCASIRQATHGRRSPAAARARVVRPCLLRCCRLPRQEEVWPCWRPNVRTHHLINATAAWLARAPAGARRMQALRTLRRQGGRDGSGSNRMREDD